MAYAVRRANGFTGYYRDVFGKRKSAGVYPTKEEAVIRARDLSTYPGHDDSLGCPAVIRE